MEETKTKIKQRSLRLLVVTFILAAASALALEDARPKPPATLLPPAEFDSSTINSITNATTTPPPTTNTTKSANTTITPTSIHSNTTTLHTTTHNATTANTTTAHPTTANTTTAHPTTANTTTVHPTTANTTTAHPTTANTTTAHPTTHAPPKPEPTPKANLTVGNYTVKNEGKLCVMVQAAIQVHVNNSEVDGIYILQPAAVTTTGKCDNTAASLSMQFTEGSIAMGFFKNDTTKTVYVRSLEINLSYAFKSGAVSNISKKNESIQLFSMAVSHSYSCVSEFVYMGDGVSLEISKDRMQAFNFTSNQFGQPDLCKADQPNYSVAIAVGIVLIILIVIVVLAYFISRRKRSDGYQSL